VSGTPDGVPAHAPLVPPLAEQGALAMSLAEMQDWGRRFGKAAHAPVVVVLHGDLGAGKTTLVQAICRGYGVTE
jgi:tRNA A37 threonylcarbamoyladenosine biosynthesis protein TsaE